MVIHTITMIVINWWTTLLFDSTSVTLEIFYPAHHSVPPKYIASPTNMINDNTHHNDGWMTMESIPSSSMPPPVDLCHIYRSAPTLE